MAKRLLIGKPNNEDYGLYVSKEGVDIIDGSNNLTSQANLQFDSEVGLGSLNLKNYGEGLLGIPGNDLATVSNIDTSDTSAVITHNLGFIPYVIVQWCFQSDISSGVATKMYPANLDWNSNTTFSSGTSGNNLQTRGGVTFSVTSTTLTIRNNFIGQLKKILSSGTETSRAYSGGVGIGYAYLIFDLQGA